MGPRANCIAVPRSPCRDSLARHHGILVDVQPCARLMRCLHDRSKRWGRVNTHAKNATVLVRATCGGAWKGPGSDYFSDSPAPRNDRLCPRGACIVNVSCAAGRQQRRRAANLGRRGPTRKAQETRQASGSRSDTGTVPPMSPNSSKMTTARDFPLTATRSRLRNANAGRAWVSTASLTVRVTPYSLQRPSSRDARFTPSPRA
jgi:hypothetical protein